MRRHASRILLGLSACVLTWVGLDLFVASRGSGTPPLQVHHGVEPLHSTSRSPYSLGNDKDGSRYRAQGLPSDETVVDAAGAANLRKRHFLNYGGLDIGNGLILDDIVSKELSMTEADRAIRLISEEAFRLTSELIVEDPAILETAASFDEALQQADDGGFILTHKDLVTDERLYIPCPANLAADIAELHDAACYLLNEPHIIAGSRKRMRESMMDSRSDEVYEFEFRKDNLGHIARDSTGAVVSYSVRPIPGRVTDYTLPD